MQKLEQIALFRTFKAKGSQKPIGKFLWHRGSVKGSKQSRQLIVIKGIR
jgi:hypothetical protein